MTHVMSVGFALVLSLIPAAALADTTPPPKDPQLKQTVRADELAGAGKAELAKGHVDLGPRMTPRGWKLLARDDTANPPMWRDPGEVLVRVADAAKLVLPEDPAYAFLGVPAGDQVYVVPQTQNQQVVWLGWNTQDPAVTTKIDRGAKLVFHRVQGPGSFHVFLQNGFDKPQQLWDGSGKDGQEIWVDVNTHTHANWVFSKPGTYLVDLSVTAKGTDGTPYEDRATVRFAVGDETRADDAWTAFLPPEPSGSGSGPSATANAPLNAQSGSNTEQTQTSSVSLVAAAVALGLLLIMVLIWLSARRSQSARKRSGLDG